MKLSLAKRNAIARANQGRHHAAAERRSTLHVPRAFRDARDFLAALRDLVETMPLGTRAEIARDCGVDTGTVSKWLLGKKVPLQERLDQLIAWWRVNRDRSVPLPARRTSSAGAAQSIALTRLPGEITARLSRTARLRNASDAARGSRATVQSSALQRAVDERDSLANLVLLDHPLFHQLARVQHRPVIAAAESIADLVQ